ncbi:transcriptional regulator, AraC family [Bradyrhizobium oligotrophicum S58]|uniref:Transcriptional regulator, AraC family n=1 Tax=Bradyrhizobium oligotrophicum S58 TaxID=1245469 RepID=M4ZMF7_9BRAD|nr:AraC family transcriptional regulator [Bradyrhizobium oligotrophicum]BAM87420.1 transcriptional regulator, AraC family [Bradyrhizobium oligotrophicum S58]
MSVLDQTAAASPGWPAHAFGSVKTRRTPPNRGGAVIAQTSLDRVDLFRQLVVPAGEDEVVISHISRRLAGHGSTESQARKAGYAVCVHLDELASYDVWSDERHCASPPLAAGTIHISDMRHTWQADIQSSFQVANFYLPQSALDEVAEGQGSRGAGTLHCPIVETRSDSVVTNVAMALLPALMRPEQASKIFLDHAWRALTAHLLKTYGSSDARPQIARGGLSPWQERRAKEMLLADLNGNVTLPDLAQACRLSCSHFSQAFRRTVGCPPHRWLLSQRVERSKELMLNSDQPLSEIALNAGFADQSHFTRVFSRMVKTSPAAWKRAQER